MSDFQFCGLSELIGILFFELYHRSISLTHKNECFDSNVKLSKLHSWMVLLNVNYFESTIKSMITSSEIKHLFSHKEVYERLPILALVIFLFIEFLFLLPGLNLFFCPFRGPFNFIIDNPIMRLAFEAPVPYGWM